MPAWSTGRFFVGLCAVNLQIRSYGIPNDEGHEFERSAEAIRAELAQVKEQLGGNVPELDRVISSLESLGGRLDSMSTDISNIIPDVTEIPPTDAPEPTPEPDTLEGGNGTPVEPTEPTEEI